jgi:hypothetical protein
VNGHNGAPIAGAHIHLWYDEPSGPGYIVSTDSNGNADMPQPIGQPIRVLVQISGLTDCRKLDPNAPPEGYNLATIAKSGLASNNTCGAIAVHTHPGELVFYMRPARWYDNLNRDQR